MFDFKTFVLKVPGKPDTNLSNVLDENDIVIYPDMSKPIIKKSGINKISKYANFYRRKPTFETREITVNNTVDKIVICTVEYYALTGESTESFYGVGEASHRNLGDPTGIGASYPIAMAEKRADSRAILAYLGLDFYGEDESPSFAKIVKDNVTGDNIPNSLSAEEKAQIASTWAKKELITHAKNMCMKLLDMTEDESKTLFRYILGIEEGKKISLGDLDYDSLIKILAAIEIKRSLGSKTYDSFLEMYKKI